VTAGIQHIRSRRSRLALTKLFHDRRCPGEHAGFWRQFQLRLPTTEAPARPSPISISWTVYHTSPPASSIRQLRYLGLIDVASGRNLIGIYSLSDRWRGTDENEASVSLRWPMRSGHGQSNRWPRGEVACKPRVRRLARRARRETQGASPAATHHRPAMISRAACSGLDPRPLSTGGVMIVTPSNAAGARSGRSWIGSPSPQPRNINVAQSARGGASGAALRWILRALHSLDVQVA